MAVRDLIPWGRSGGTGLQRGVEQDPLLALHREMNRLFDDVFRGFATPGFGRVPTMASWGPNWPNVEISETDKEIRVVAEVPGLEEKDIEILLEDGMLTLRGEKKSETEDKERQFSERFYGRFERRVSLGTEVDEEKVDAHFKNGVLTVTLPKTAPSQSKAKRIAVTH